MTTSPNRIRSFEQNHSLFNVQINGVPIWERIRVEIWRKIKHQHGSGQSHTGINKTVSDYLKGGTLFTKNFFFRNPFFADETEILFAGHQRRKKEPDGYWWDIYCDPIHQRCEYDYIHFETDHLLGHLNPAKTDNLRYLDVITYGSTIQNLLKINNISLSDSEQRQLKQLQYELNQEFSTDIRLIERVKKELGHRKRRLPLYRKLLGRINPKFAVVVVGYNKETLIEACHELDIPVVELQHGVIYQDHFGYAYPGLGTKETFPDYLLVWGDFWKETVEYPIPDERVIPVGYPYLEQSVKKYTEMSQTDQIIFISQGTIGEELSKFALEISEHPEIKHDIVYKLHPGEYDRWQDEYPWLMDTDFEVIDSSEPPLYELFAESSVQIGVGSTAVYEGLAFGLETYVFGCTDSSVLQPLVDEGAAELISTSDELAKSLGTMETSFNKEFYFKSNATENTCETLRELKNEGTVYQP